MAAPVIKVDRVTKEFRLGQLTSAAQTMRNGIKRLLRQPVAEAKPFKALDDLNFEVQAGEVLGVVGHNGAGKSTLLKTLSGISQPTRGTVRVDGRVAPLIEVGAGLVPDLTGRENVYLNAAMLGMRKVEIARKFDEIVAFSELDDFIDTPVKRYSSGMQIKLGFSIATSVEAEILIVDEVLAVGDLAFQRKCFDRVETIIRRQGRTVILVSHNIRQVERLCTRTLLLERGRLIQDGLPRTVCNHFFELMDRKAIAAAAPGALASSRQMTSGDLDVASFEVLNDQGMPVESCRYGDALCFKVTLRVHRMVRRPSIGVGVHTTDLLYLATSQSIDALDLPELCPGLHQVFFKVRRFPFVPGVYSFRVGVALGDSFQALFYAENIGQILVTSDDTTRPTEKSEGFIAMEGQWSCDSVLRVSSQSNWPAVSPSD